MSIFWSAGGVCKVCLFYIQWAPEYRKQFAKCPTRLEQNFRDWARIWDIFNVTVFELPEKRHECTFKVNLKTSQNCESRQPKVTSPLFRGQLGTLGGNSPWGGISSPPSNFDRRVGEISPPLQNSTGGWGRFLPPLVGILPTHPSKY